MRTLTVPLLTVLLLSLLVLAACDPGRPVTAGAGRSGDSSNNGTSARIGPGGGHVTGPDGVELEIPAGAVASEVEITVSQIDPSTIGALPAGFEAVGRAYAIRPFDLALDAPAVVALPIASGASPTATARAEDLDAAEWTMTLELTKLGGKAIFEVWALGVFVLAQPRTFGSAGDGGSVPSGSGPDAETPGNTPRPEDASTAHGDARSEDATAEDAPGSSTDAEPLPDAGVAADATSPRDASAPPRSDASAADAAPPPPPPPPQDASYREDAQESCDICPP
ncbi:MAG: hypothetical protein IT384_28125 [Deltaproteobacteria bacterium]|nr:hypothetical protein [Deltaproteobacteria bacterium]